jgi:hypothetical protein
LLPYFVYIKERLFYFLQLNNSYISLLQLTTLK